MKKLKGVKRIVQMRKSCVVDLQVMKKICQRVNDTNSDDMDSEFFADFEKSVREFEEFQKNNKDLEKPIGKFFINQKNLILGVYKENI